MIGEKTPREFWIDDVLNFDRPHTKTAYIYEQDCEKFNGAVIHVIEYSAFEKLLAENKKYIKALLKISAEIENK